MNGYPIKIVQGNWFRLIQPIEKISWEGQTKEITDYVPQEGDVIQVTLIGAYSPYEMIDITIDGNVLKYENKARYH